MRLTALYGVADWQFLPVQQCRPLRTVKKLSLALSGDCYSFDAPCHRRPCTPRSCDFLNRLTVSRSDSGTLSEQQPAVTSAC